MWFFRRMLRFSWTVKKSKEIDLREAGTIRSLIIKYVTPSNIFWSCDEKRETRTYCDNWNDGK